MQQSNILFIFTDQQAYFGEWPSGYSLPGIERLQEAGVTFHNHYCPATQCTSARSEMMTGLQTADTGMYENLELVMTMNAKLEVLIEEEIGADDGRELPEMEGVSWEVRPTGDAIVLD